MPNATSTVYNLIPSAEQNTILGFISSVNDMTGGLMMPGILLVTFVILFTALLKNGTSDALLASGFVTVVIGLLFTALDFIPRWMFILMVIGYGGFYTYRIVQG